MYINIRVSDIHSVNVCIKEPIAENECFQPKVDTCHKMTEYPSHVYSGVTCNISYYAVKDTTIR